MCLPVSTVSTAATSEPLHNAKLVARVVRWGTVLAEDWLRTAGTHSDTTEFCVQCRVRNPRNQSPRSLGGESGDVGARGSNSAGTRGWPSQ